MIKMENIIYAVPRKAFQWLDDTSVIVSSVDGKEFENGHCVLLDTVGSLFMLVLPNIFRELLRVKRLMLTKWSFVRWPECKTKP